MEPATPVAATGWTGMPSVSVNGVRMMPIGRNVTGSRPDSHDSGMVGSLVLDGEHEIPPPSIDLGGCQVGLNGL